MIKIAWQYILAVILGIIALIGIANWSEESFDYCEEVGWSDDCFISVFMNYPKVKEVTDLAEACGESDQECIKEFGKQMAFKKLEQKSNEYEK